MIHPRLTVLVALVCVLLSEDAVRGQEPSVLIADGRFEEAVALLSVADSAEAEAAAIDIFTRASQQGLERGDVPRFLRGVVAAEQLPNLSPRIKSELGFWKGYGLFRLAVAEQAPQTLATAQATLPTFQEALVLMQTEFPPPFVYFLVPGISTPRLAEDVRTYIQIQEAVIRRGR
jgi:hypothetical protein